MENAKITNLYNLDETIAKEYLSQFTYQIGRAHV